MARNVTASRLLPLGLLAGCATSTGVLPAGPDTYIISAHYAPARGGAIGAQQATVTEAAKFCADQGRQLLPLNMGVAPGAPIQTNIYGPTNYSLTFRCLLPGDPELRRPQFEQAPNVVIEQRNR